MTEQSNALVKRGPLVLVVDDDPAILRVVELLLDRNGYTVRTAANGQEALKALRKIVPDVLVLDVVMPGMSGYDVCQIVKRDARLQNVPVIFLTAQGSPQDFKAGHDAGAVIYMTKPFQPDRLLGAIRLACAAQPPAQE